MQKILINDKEYYIVLNFGTIKDTCKQFNITVPEMIKRLSESVLVFVGEILYHGIKFNCENFDRIEINRLPLCDIFTVIEVLGELLQNSMPRVDKKKLA